MRQKSITWRALKRYNAYNPKYFPLCFLQKVFQNLFFFFELWITAEIVNALYEGRQKEELYLLAAAAVFGLFFTRSVSAVLNRAVSTALEVLENNENAAFNHKTLSLDYGKLEDPEILQHRRKIDENKCINNYGTGRMREILLSLMDSTVNILFSMILFGSMLGQMTAASFRWQILVLLGALTGCLAMNILCQFRQTKRISSCWDEIGDLMLRENRLWSGHILAGTDSRLYRQQAIVSRENRKLNNEHKKAFQKVKSKNFILKIPVTIFNKLTTACSYMIVCFYCVMGIFSVGDLIRYVGYLGRVTDSIWLLFSIAADIRGNERFLKTYLDYFDIENEMYQGNLAVEKRSDKKFDISFRHVSFRYPGSEAFALRDISLDLKVGERLAVVGMNGSGKTTFIKLLCRLYDPGEGEILMNDFNIRKYNYRQYLDLFSVVFQDYHLLSMPLGNNVAGSAAYDREKAERLLEEAGFGERYHKMPQGLETPLYKDFDEDGVEISGGEAQKIALARALYKDAPFIILDEPTAALDPIAEAEIYAKFDEIAGDKTAIYISHRLSSCRFCDKIAVFHEGRIVQTGSHEELLSDPAGKYYELWNAQAQYYT
ncbi:MAG TPA: ABC transporter ATP-binding protein [Lachnospiraceae bacterium]|nr:ABC transporter ATP-binding protein [Lachnospiraceae bacterium]